MAIGNIWGWIYHHDFMLAYSYALHERKVLLLHVSADVADVVTQRTDETMSKVVY